MTIGKRRQKNLWAKGVLVRQSETRQLFQTTFSPSGIETMLFATVD
jgi:hypothetical protein